MLSELQLRKYLALFGATAAALFVLVVAFNFAMDPYFIWGWTWNDFNRIRPWVTADGTSELAAKVRAPQTIIVGTSQIIIGFDPASPAMRAWGETLSEPEFSFRIEREAQIVGASAQGGRLRNAIVEIDPRAFWFCRAAAVPPFGTRNYVDAALHVLMMPALFSSARALMLTWFDNVGIRPRTAYVLPSGRAVPATQESLQTTRNVAVSYTTRMFSAKMDRNCKDLGSRNVMRALDGLVGLARAKHVRIVLFVPPWHRELLREIYVRGYWPMIEETKLLLADYAARNKIAAWDFSTAALRFAAPRANAYFYDNAHFRPALGDQMVEEMRAGRSPAALGTVLTPSDIGQVLQDDRRRMEGLAHETQSAAAASAPRAWPATP